MNQQIRAGTRSQRAQLPKEYTNAEKNLAARNVIAGRWTLAHAAKMTRCVKSTVHRWTKQYRNGEFMYSSGGRPAFIDPESKKKIISEVAGTSTSTVKISKRRFSALVQQGANDTSMGHNKPRKDISRRFVHDFQVENKINEGNAEVIDNAHLVALNDPRHALSFAAMHCFLRKNVPSGLFVTFDKTRFDLPKSDQQKARAVYLQKRQQSVKVSQPNDQSSRGNCSVALFVVASDSGKLADLVYLVKDDNMAVDTIDVHPAPILDPSGSTKTNAYLVFTGKSSSNKEISLEWLINNIVVPFITDLRKLVVSGDRKAANVQVDGDPRQLQVLAGQSILDICKLHNIIISKSSASCTPTEAPLDEGHVFLAAKTRFHSLVVHGYTPSSPQDVETLKTIFRDHMAKHHKKLKKDGKPSLAFTSYFNDVIKCLYTAVEALRRTPLSEVVRNSFQTSGVAPFDPSVIRDKCQYNWTTAQKDHFVKAVPALSKIFGTNYELKEKDFDDAGIPANNPSRDGLAVHRRRALLLHAPHILKDLLKQAVGGPSAEN